MGDYEPISQQVGYLFCFLLIILCSLYIAWRKYKQWRTEAKEKFIDYKVIKPPSKLISEGEVAKRKRVCAVVGGTGFIGSHVVNELVERGEYYVYVLGRTFRPERTNPDADCLIQVDMRDVDGLTKAFQGVDSVINAAAYIPTVFAKADEIRRVNKNGVENVMRAMKEAGVKHFVQVTAFPITQRLKNPTLKAFIRSMDETRTLATEANGKDGLTTCVLGPPNVIGQHGIFTREIISGKLRDVPMSDIMPVSFMPVAYLARAIVNAEAKLAAGSKEVAGKFFPLQGELMSWKTLFQLPTWPHKLRESSKWVTALSVKVNTFFASVFGWAPFGSVINAGLLEMLEVAVSDEVDPAQLTEAYDVLGVGPPHPPIKDYIAEVVNRYKASQEARKEK